VVCNRFVSWDLSQVYFADFVVIERTRLSSDFGDLYWLGGLVFPSEFLNLTKLQNINFVIAQFVARSKG
jgi:hypothetical protein